MVEGTTPLASRRIPSLQQVAEHVDELLEHADEHQAQGRLLNADFLRGVARDYKALAVHVHATSI